MPKHIQIRNVPESLHRTLKARAAEAGMSLSDYLLADIRQRADRMTWVEANALIEARGRIKSKESPAELVQRARREA